MKNDLSSYFSFTQKERKSVVILVSLILFFLLLPFVYPLFIRPKQYDHTQFEKEIAALRVNNNDSSNIYGTNTAYYNEPLENNEKELPTELFYFDPNTINETDWKRLGIKDKTIQTIQKYLSKGGRFRKPEDISKIWGIPPSKAQQLIPYIKIEQQDLPNKDRTFTPFVYEKKEYKKEVIPIDVNLADTTAYIALPGIGNKLANRIVTFRNKLGGFYAVDQVAETFGLPDSTFQKIKPRLILNNTSVTRININTATIDEMKIHPYMRYVIANAIVQYRSQHGNYASVNDIQKIILIDDTIFKKLSPYLKVD